MAAKPAELIQAALTSADAAPFAQLSGVPPVAVGWATVELERAERELCAALGLSADDFGPAASSIALGARCRIAPGVLGDALALVLLEPETEGRLAATLARLGEGPAVVWLVVEGRETRDAASARDAVAATDEASASLRSSGVITAAVRPGPLGPERLVLGGPIHGPHHLLVALRVGADLHSRDDGPAGTIQP